MLFDSETYRLREPGRFGDRALLIGILSLAVTFVGYAFNAPQFFHSYLLALVFWVTLTLGGLFFIHLHYLTGSVWSVVVRRITETLIANFPLLALLFIPVLIGIPELYHWSHGDLVAHDPLLQKKTGYLNIPFFTIRALGYFLIWSFLARVLYKGSLQQDQDATYDPLLRLKRVSAPGMILFAVTLTFASFDWLMSLNAHWYSTIFGVYIFAGSYLAILAFLVVFLMQLHRRGILTGTVTVEHYHDLGKLLFAFTVFWAYIAGSQYFLIWYGNVPEETVWFLDRWKGSWKILSLLIPIGHFTIPFLVLLFRATKRNLTVLGSMAVLILVMHWADLYWIIGPNLHPDGLRLSWMDLTAMVGIGGIFLGLFWKRLARHPLVPVNDPRLTDSINFINV
jgi:hypothetical protein